MQRLQVDRRLVDNQGFTEGPHPVMVLVELLASRQGSPGDQLMNVRVPGIIADMLALDPGPDRRGDDLARLGNNVPEPDLLVFLWPREMGVLPARLLFERFPSADRHLTVGFRGEHQDCLASIDVGLYYRSPFGDGLVEHPAVQ